ncbi:MAG: 16S rRNA (guanine(966)-N(2))-methyltransferase RsmD [Pseudomonadota bacterium]
MRITGGQARGRRLASSKGLKIRPTSDKVREAIFNLIGQDMTGLDVLDLFAGTGSLGIEALSRGASDVVFIDHSIQSIRLIKKNLLLCGHESAGRILKRDLIRGLPRKPLPINKFDIVFLDPPYGKGFILPILRELIEKEVLASPATVIAESSKIDDHSPHLEKIKLINSRVYGLTRITIYQYPE